MPLSLVAEGGIGRGVIGDPEKGGEGLAVGTEAPEGSQGLEALSGGQASRRRIGKKTRD